jgi:hypothetical protein
MTTFYCLRFETPPNFESQVPVFISPRNKVAQLYPQALSSLSVVSYGLQGIRSRLLMGYHDLKVKVIVTLQLAVYRQSVRLGFRPLGTHD